MKLVAEHREAETMNKTKQRFEYTHNKEPKVYLMMPNEYTSCVNMLLELDRSLEYVAGWIGVDIRYIDSGSLRLVQEYVSNVKNN